MLEHQAARTAGADDRTRRALGVLATAHADVESTEPGQLVCWTLRHRQSQRGRQVWRLPPAMRRPRMGWPAMAGHDAAAAVRSCARCRTHFSAQVAGAARAHRRRAEFKGAPLMSPFVSSVSGTRAQNAPCWTNGFVERPKARSSRALGLVFRRVLHQSGGLHRARRLHAVLQQRAPHQGYASAAERRPRWSGGWRQHSDLITALGREVSTPFRVGQPSSARLPILDFGL